MIRIYLTPFQDDGSFGSEIEITSKVDIGSLGKVKRSLSNSTYDIGVLRYNSLNLKLHNSQGEFSDVDNLRSVFRFRRSGSKIRITWAPAEPAICGNAICGETILAEEVTIFRGILNDDASKMDIKDQILEFNVLSYDSQFAKVLVPYADLSGGDTLKDILVKILNQDQITKYCDVDEDNINLQIDYIPDDITVYEDLTGQEAIEKIMLAANSIIYVEDDVLKACGREAGETVVHHFYGQSSPRGNENIFSIGDFRNGQNRIINFVRWKDGAAIRSPGSIESWGAFLKELSIDFVTNSGKQELTAQSIVDEFKDPKREMRVETILDAKTVELRFLNRVDIDYPSVVDSAGKYLPIVGLAKIGDVESPLPNILWDFRMSQDQPLKIMGMEIDLKKEMISFELRAI